MKADKAFGQTANFKVVLHEIAYVKDEPKDFSRKLFLGDKYEQVHPIEEAPKNVIQLTEKRRPRLVASDRKVIFAKQEGSGIIIGQTIKREGEYLPSTESYYNGDCTSEAEPPQFNQRKAVAFWIIATGINKTVLAEKESTEIIATDSVKSKMKRSDFKTKEDWMKHNKNLQVFSKAIKNKLC